MPLKFGSAAAYERWLAETEKREYRTADHLLTRDKPRPVRSSTASSIPSTGPSTAKKKKPSRIRHHAGRPIRHVIRTKGARRRGVAVIRTLLGPFR